MSLDDRGPAINHPGQRFDNPGLLHRDDLSSCRDRIDRLRSTQKNDCSQLIREVNKSLIAMKSRSDCRSKTSCRISIFTGVEWTAVSESDSCLLRKQALSCRGPILSSFRRHTPMRDCPDTVEYKTPCCPSSLKSNPPNTSSSGNASTSGAVDL